MSDKTRMGLSVLGAALVLGLLGDGLLRATPWGLNAPLWTGLLALVGLAVARSRRVSLGGEGRWLLAPAILFAAALAWRDSPTLVFLNTLAAAVSLGLAATHSRSGRIRLAGVTHYALDLLAAAVAALAGLLPTVAADVGWKEVPRGGAAGHLLAVARGLVIALPLLVLFGCLFVAADAAFEGLVTGFFQWNPASLASHLLLVALWAWLAGGFLRKMLQETRQAVPAGEARRPLTLGIIEVGVVLGLLDALFLLFVLVQFRYFFGGVEVIRTSGALSYAEYARRGFFELATVATLALPFLLLADWILRRESARQERVFRGLAAALVVLLFVIMASALLRMRLYMIEFGLTELRLYTTAFIGWLAIVFAWLLATVLRGRRQRFAFGALVAGFGAVALLNALNPDAYIVLTNVSRASPNAPLDAPYIASLSADAVPALIELLPRMPEDERRLVSERLLRERSLPEGADWRTWNWGRSQASQMVEAHRAALQEAALP